MRLLLFMKRNRTKGEKREREEERESNKKITYTLSSHHRSLFRVHTLVLSHPSMFRRVYK
jgi:hypothetical protein